MSDKVTTVITPIECSTCNQMKPPAMLIECDADGACSYTMCLECALKTNGARSPFGYAG